MLTLWDAFAYVMNVGDDFEVSPLSIMFVYSF